MSQLPQSTSSGYSDHSYHDSLNTAYTGAATGPAEQTDLKKSAYTRIKSIEIESEPTQQELVDAAHEKRHMRRIQISRAVQHTLTSVLSIVVACLQGKVYLNYLSTKSIPGAWPEFPNLLPTLTLFVTALVALVVDLCALCAYIWPDTAAGKRAYQIAHAANYVTKTFKAISYAYSVVVCRISYNQGNASGQNTDLWSWSCSPQSDAHAQMTSANTNCTSSNISWYLSIVNIGIEVLSTVIDQIQAWDQARWKNLKLSQSNIELASPKATPKPESDAKPLLASKAPLGMTDDEYDDMIKLQDSYDGTLTSSLKSSFKEPQS